MPAATEAAEEMARLVRHVREALPTARIVLQAPLPKGDYWPNRCTPAFELFNGRLQVCVCFFLALLIPSIASSLLLASLHATVVLSMRDLANCCFEGACLVVLS